MKNTLEGINNTVIEAERWISELEDRLVEITFTEQNKEKRVKRNEDDLRDSWDNIKCTNIWFIGVPGKEEKECEKMFEKIIVKNFPNMGKGIVTQVQEAENPIQDTPKEKHAKIYINQSNKN